jgi:DNA-binding LacI/PurR family transcriptional regulator
LSADDDKARGRAGAPTIIDVAAAANVSKSTVSRYLSGERVRNGDRIAAAVEALRYRPNMEARGLRSGARRAIAAVVHDITNPYNAAVVQGVEAIVAEHGYKLYLAEGRRAPDEVIRDMSMSVDGIICSAATDEAEVMAALRDSGRPAVLLEFEPRERDHGFDTVVVDGETGARHAIEYLIGLGHRDIGILAGPSTLSPGRERVRGVQLAFEAAGIPPEDAAIEVSDFSWQGGYDATATLMGRASTPTAIFASNNLMSLGCLHCLRDLGVRVPADVSFVGFDPLDSCELFDPPPTTVERPQREQGALAMRLLESRIAGRVTGAPRRIVLETRLAVRDSCARPGSSR